MANPITDTLAWKKIDKARVAYQDALIERDEEIDLVLIGLIIRHHVLLVGDPGCAKSYLVDLLCELIDGKKFTRILHPLSVPEELFGSVDFKAYKEGKYQRIVTGKMPEANVAFIDEIFKSSSAILNILLKILNERKFENDGKTLDCPLDTCVGASNEWNSGSETNALFDRFLLRRTVKNIQSNPGLDKLLWADDTALKPQGVETISRSELTEANRAAMSLPVSEEAKEAVRVIVRDLRREGVVTGDRRLRQSILAVKGQAFLEGSDEVTTDHLEVLSHVLWIDPKDQPEFVAEVVGRTANPVGIQVNKLVVEASELIEECDLESTFDMMEKGTKLDNIRKKLRKLPGRKAQNTLGYIGRELSKIQGATAGQISVNVASSD